MTGPRIGGIEPAEPTPETLTPRPENQAQEASLSPRQEPKTAQRLNGLFILVAGLALAAAIGAGAYAHRLGRRMTVLQSQLAQTRAATQATLDRLTALKIPKDCSADIASLEITANKLRAADEALRRSFDEQSQKIPALEGRVADAHNTLAARLAEAGQELKAFQGKEETRITNIIAVLKNQDKVLRRLTEPSEPHPAPQSQE